ncbi:MAG: DUF3164 family protein [Bacteroides sp.]|nr:DUF3164 family protein [Bacteroides sp.]
MEENVKMTAEERAEFEAFKAERDKKRREEERKRARENYAKLVDDEVATSLAQLSFLSEEIKTVKETVYGNFKTVLEMKQELFGAKADGQRSHTFTTSDSKFRITLGVNTIDGYRDTVEDGVSMVKEYIESLAKDEKTKALVKAVLRLLSRDQSGNIKASRVLQLRKMAEDSGDERFLEGVKIIEESYQPTETKRFIRAERKNDKGAWVTVPLSMTDAD